MWIIIKFKQNQFYTLKQEFKKKLEIEPNFFFPKLKLQKIKNCYKFIEFYLHDIYACAT